MKSACNDASGSCHARPKSCDNAEKVVCGCDGVSYWNDCLRAENGSAAATAGACGTNATTCGGIAGIACPGKSTCAYPLKSSASCGISDPAGVCWGLPQQCPVVVIGGSERYCSSPSLTCASRCAALESGKTFYTDNTCPI